MKRYSLYISGEDVDAASGASFDALNPTTGEIWATHALAGAEDVDHAVRAAAAAFENEAWRGLSPTRRGRLMMRWADLIAERAEAIAEVEVADNGKLFKEMVGQLRAIPDWLYYFGGLADKVEGRVIPLDRTSVSQLHAARAARRCRNHHSLELAGAVDDVLARTGAGGRQHHRRQAVRARQRERDRDSCGSQRRSASRGASSTSSPATREAGEALVEHPARREDLLHRKRQRPGAAIAAQAGARLAPVDARTRRQEPEHRLPDADLDAAEAGVLAGIFAAAGQTCVAGSRALFQPRDLRRAARTLVTRRAAEVVLGDPMDETTQMGPDRERAAIRRGSSRWSKTPADGGARVVTGGTRATVDGVPTRALVRPDDPRRRRQRRLRSRRTRSSARC